MRPRKVKVSMSCPFCGREVKKEDPDSDFMVRKHEYLREKKQYFHKTCFQRFYSVRSSEHDRTASSTKSN